MSCQHIRDELSAFFDGELVDGRREQILLHLQDCESCRQVLGSYQTLREVATGFGRLVPPESVWLAIRDGLATGDPKTGDPSLVRPTGPAAAYRRPFWSFRSIAFVAALVLMVLVGGWLQWGWGRHHDLHSDAAWLVEHLESSESVDYLRNKYGGRVIDSNQLPDRFGYRPVVDRGVPEGYVVDQIQLLDMPCCQCLQTTCLRADGSRLMILEHENRSVRFLAEPRKTLCCGLECQIDQVSDKLIVTVQTPERGVTIVGLRDEKELESLLDGWSLPESQHQNNRS